MSNEEKIADLRLELMKDFGITIDNLPKHESIDQRDKKLIELCYKQLGASLNNIRSINRSQSKPPVRPTIPKTYQQSSKYSALSQKLISSIKNKQQNKENSTQFEWDQQFEQKFRLLRQQAKKELQQQYTSSSMNDLTITSLRKLGLIQTRGTHNTITESDRTFAQQQLAKLSKHQLQQLELAVANSVIEDYTSNLKVIKEVRTKFLNEKVAKEAAISKKYQKAAPKPPPKSLPRSQTPRQPRLAKPQNPSQSTTTDNIKMKQFPLNERYGLTRKQLLLFMAAKNNDMKLIRQISSTITPLDVNQKDPQQNTPLFYAALNGNTLMAVYLWGLGAKINIPCSNGMTELHAAFTSENLDLIYFLLEKGGNLNVYSSDQLAPLDYASDKLVELLSLEAYTGRARIMEPKKLMEAIKGVKDVQVNISEGRPSTGRVSRRIDKRPVSARVRGRMLQQAPFSIEIVFKSPPFINFIIIFAKRYKFLKRQFVKQILSSLVHTKELQNHPISNILHSSIISVSISEFQVP